MKPKTVFQTTVRRLHHHHSMASVLVNIVYQTVEALASGDHGANGEAVLSHVMVVRRHDHAHAHAETVKVNRSRLVNVTLSVVLTYLNHKKAKNSAVHESTTEPRSQPNVATTVQTIVLL